MMLSCSSLLFWGRVVRELFCVDWACSTCFLWHLKGRECKSKLQFSPVARVANRPLLLLGNKMDFFLTTRCVCSMPEDKLSLPENTSRSSRQFCCLLRPVQPDVSEVWRDSFFPLPQFLPNDRRPHLNSVPFLTHCLTSSAEDPCVVYTCPHFCSLPSPSIALFLHFSWQSRIIFQGTLGSLSWQNPWSSFCTKRNAISLEEVMCARADDSERTQSGWMVLKVWGWGSVMMQAAQSTTEDVQHACAWSLAGSEACFKIKIKQKLMQDLRHKKIRTLRKLVSNDQQYPGWWMGQNHMPILTAALTKHYKLFKLHDSHFRKPMSAFLIKSGNKWAIKIQLRKRTRFSGNYVFHAQLMACFIFKMSVVSWGHHWTAQALLTKSQSQADLSCQSRYSNISTSLSFTLLPHSKCCYGLTSHSSRSPINASPITRATHVKISI